ncbi:hypothetical protein DL89DRAFT_275428 [Linderina pennispora]|uniref:Pro-apoptotic serine protease NMA111 n=1 Tax=Linderina pennispora TaxID=61395 RepID=A0A1Y1W4G2_9FUNG|nr:uncharacterized protein DL89DRAFT_275428 [Linderina pennispora]ORX68411.1 hypothetical protein DL89DRAFT_275428 [Linderina pennispora]
MDDDSRFQTHTPVPLRQARPPENATADSELGSKRSLFAQLMKTPRIGRHRSLDLGALVAESAVNAIVTIRFCQTVAFDTTSAVASEASGFVVDKERGIILTNRHVACAGPFVGEAVFQNREQVNVHTIYRDPIHDFGFLKYSPSDVKYYDVHELPLDPSRAKLGTEIRIIGNDAGEELSILAGQISRIDRNAPDFGPMTYNDFNTFYLQAAASSSGGSSGSPVIDIHGSAIALQAAGRNEGATDFFLPLDRVKRALELVQAGKPVDRGDIQVQFHVAETVLPEGPGDIAGLVTGDVLVSINERIVTKFADLDEILDNSIGKQVRTVIERDGDRVEHMIEVQDVNSITPDRFVEMGGAVLHNLSYQLARYYCVQATGVFVAQVWGMLPLEDAGEGVVIRSVDGHETPTLDDFIQVIRRIPDRTRVPVVYYSLNDIHEETSGHWTDMNIYTRSDDTGVWECETVDPPSEVCQVEQQTARFATSANPNCADYHSVADSGPLLHAMDDQCIPKLLGKTPVRTAQLATKGNSEGDQLMLHAYNDGKGLASIRAMVSTVGPMTITKHSPPRFRSINADWFKLDTRAAQKYNTGVLTDMDGVVSGMWVSYIDDMDDEGTNNEYFYGLDVCKILPVLEPLRRDEHPKLRTLGVELSTISLVEARHLGLDRSWIGRIEDVSPHHRQLLMISRIVCGSRCSDVLNPLDVVLTVDGKVATQFADFDRAFSAPSLTLQVLRHKQVVEWSGAILHEPHTAVRQQCRQLPSRTYVSYNAYGSPAYTAGMAPTSFVTHVEDMETPDLDAFLSTAKSSFVCVRIVGLDKIPSVISVKLNTHYWPTVELVKDSSRPNGWNRIHYDS